MKKFENRAITIDCEGSTLVGVVTVPKNCKRVGILTVVAGGPQYRGGCGRQLVELSRVMGEVGVPVLRFDYRGMGDSEGTFQDFQHIRADLIAAIGAFKNEVPELSEIVLWGGCNAASAILINAATIENVAGMIISNPFVTSESLAARARRAHYLERLGQREFWKKLFSGKYSISDYAKSLLRKNTGDKPEKGATNGRTGNHSDISFPVRMLDGFEKFQGCCLLALSGRSLDSKRFQMLIDSEKRWKKAMSRDVVTTEVFPEADQAFSVLSSRSAFFGVAVTWISRYWD